MVGLGDMKFMEFLIEGINDIGIFKAIFMAGTPGAGKSYTVSKIQNGGIGARIVNTDKFFEYLHDVDKSKLLTKEQLALYINSMLPLFVDSTSANPNALIRRQGLLESLGYDTGIIIVTTSLETALKRVSQRDRKVPEDLIKQKYKETADLLDFYKNKFNFVEEINNDEGQLTDKVILDAFRKTTGFFTAPLSNPLGTKVVNQMQEEGWKYLADGVYKIEYLKKIVDIWYKK